MAQLSVSITNGVKSAALIILITIQAESLFAKDATTSLAVRTPESVAQIPNVTYKQADGQQDHQLHMMHDAMSTSSSSSLALSEAILMSTPARKSEPPQKFMWFGKGGKAGAVVVGAPVRLKNVIPPSFLEVPGQRILFKSGTKVELRCLASGNPPPRYIWKKDDSYLNVEDAPDFSLGRESGPLVIASPQNKDQGFYQCIARNDFGLAISGTAFLRKAVLEPFPTVREPRIHQPLIGTSLTLKCRPPNSYPTGMVYWAEDSFGLQRIETSDRISLDYSGNLHFSNVLARDSLAGHSYLCILQNPELRLLSHGDDQRIDPVDPPGGVQNRAPSLMWSTSTSDIAMKGENKKLKCIFAGYPTPKISWIRLGGRMNARITMPPESFGQELLISDAQFEDAGYYQCSATNSGSPVIVVIQLRVESLPYWSTDRQMRDITAHDEDNVKFECNVLGSPPPVIRWFSNGILIAETPPNSLRHIASNYIIFSNVSQADIQVIQCNASNRHGYLLSNAYLNVLAEPPQFIETSSSLVKVTEGKTVLLKCHVFGAPKPSLAWSRGDYVLRNVTGSRFILQSSGSLEIQNITFADETIYYCHVHNKFGSANTSVHVVVRHRTEIVRPPRNQTLNVSSNVEFECSAVTDPAEFDYLIIKWYRNGVLLNRNRDPRISVDNGALRIVRTLVSDSGAYTCQASNGVDTVQAIAYLIIQDRPAPPRNVQLLYCRVSVAEVNWEPGRDNNAPVQYFIVSYSTSLDKPGTYHKAVTVDGAARHAAINLLPWLNYTFLVTALNALGESDRSDPTQPYCMTPQSKPFRNPTGVCSDLRSSFHLVIVWKPLARIELNGEGFYYLVTYQRIDIPGAPELKQVVRDWRSSELVIVNNDSTFKQYLIYVQAVNNEGFSVSNVLDVKRGYSGESKPLIRPANLRMNYNKLSCSSAELIWDPVDPKPELMRGVLRGYQIHFWKSDDFDLSSTRIEEVKLQTKNSNLLCSNTISNGAHLRQNASGVKGQIRRLWPKTRITVGVLVQNGKLTGDLGDTIEFETPDCFGFETDTESVSVEDTTDEAADATNDFTSSDEVDFQPTETFPEELYPEELETFEPLLDGSTKQGTRYDARHPSTQAGSRSMQTVLPDLLSTFAVFSRTSVKRVGTRKPRQEIPRPAKWFIGMMSAITFLLIILIIVCILKRRRGQQYPVEEKERCQGREPERAVSDISIVEYVRRFAMGRRRRLSRRILHGKRSLDSESGSLREYEDYADLDRFLEDGSFIGQYGGIQKEVEPIFSSPTAFSTFV